MAQILILNGPNLNLLGTREPQHYGQIRLQDIEKNCQTLGETLGHSIECFQSNHEGVLIELIHQAGAHQVDFIIFNPAAFTHTSVALRDALKAVAIPFIEVHLSNVHARENFRAHSYFSDIAVGTLTGLGAIAYELALLSADQYLSTTSR